MTDLAKALAAVGESAPESRVDPRRPLVADAMLELDEYRALALRLAVRLADQLEKVGALDKSREDLRGWIAWRRDWTGGPVPVDADGNTWYYCARRGDPPPHGYERERIIRCHGTGKEQPR